MKKKWKIVIAVIVAILLSVSLYFAYILKFKQYDVADADVTEIVANPYTIELPDGTTITIDEDGEVIESEAGGTVTTSGQNTGGTTGNSTTEKVAGTTTNQGGSKVETTTKPTVASVKEKYIPVFGDLQAQADGKLNALIGHAKKELADKKASGQAIDVGYFYNKYSAAATELEKNTDKIFYGAIKVVENDLVKNGFNKSYAKNFAEEYEAAKKERRDSILKKAAGI
ncbi:hypothetical protein [Sporosarcina sp. YIM B06819]|uniref:hypothetical protein n=1 Tax=Sporosarcina sp. YIM B06819 TaxID=3081769 RepID=UPI00298C49F7|nr:hypothetical protein [Sporosarcina sp. YIM B06819]